MSVREDIKVILAESNTKLKDIATELSQRTGKKISADNVSQKLRKGTLRYDDAVLIGDILGYDLKFLKRKN
jgi:hypothetical protein